MSDKEVLAHLRVTDSTHGGFKVTPDVVGRPGERITLRMRYDISLAASVDRGVVFVTLKPDAARQLADQLRMFADWMGSDAYVKWKDDEAVRLGRLMVGGE